MEDICMLCNQTCSNVIVCCNAIVCRTCLITSIIHSSDLVCPFCKITINIKNIYTLVPCQICNKDQEPVNLCKSCKNLYLCDSCWPIVHHPNTPLNKHEKYSQSDKDNMLDREELLEEHLTYHLSLLRQTKSYEQDIFDYMNKGKSNKFVQLTEIKDAFRKIRKTIDEQEQMLYDLINEQTELKNESTKKYITDIEQNLENIKKTILTGNQQDTKQIIFSNINYRNYFYNLPSISIGEQININSNRLYSEKYIDFINSCEYKSDISGYVILIIVGGGGSGNYGNGGGSGDINIVSCYLEKDKKYKITIGMSDQTTSFDDLYHAYPGKSPTDIKEGGSGTCGGGVGASRKDPRRGTSGGSLISLNGVSNDSKIGGIGYGLINTDTKYNYKTLTDRYKFISAGNAGNGGYSDNSLHNGYPGGGGGGGLWLSGYTKPPGSQNNHIYSGGNGDGFGAGGSSYFDGEKFINSEGNNGIIIICFY